jgi:GntR family transcriptional regulator, transcriptional repressor for pyruvate dehydrogenase complex
LPKQWKIPSHFDAGHVRQNRASDNAKHYLQSLVFSGQLAPGDKLPPEKQLAEQLGIAVTTLRPALKSLEYDGLITVKLGSKGGSWVGDFASVTRCWAEYLRVNKREVDQMLEFQEELEVLVASIAAGRRTDEDLQILEKAAAPFYEEGRATTRNEDVQFHFTMAKAAHNEYFEWAVAAIRRELFIPYDQYTAEEVAQLRSVHREILTAIRQGDATQTALIMRKHFALTRKLFDAGVTKWNIQSDAKNEPLIAK